MSITGIIESGEWQLHSHMGDYRAEWPGHMLVERATWQESAPLQHLQIQGVEPTLIAAPGYVWFRFWLPEDEQIVERYFDVDGNAVGAYIPICMSPHQDGNVYSAVRLGLALWIGQDGRVTVLNEDEFDAGVKSGAITPVQAEQAELRIRALTTAIAQRRFPPALVRNFTIYLDHAR
ncbi:MAG: hypothetical protein R2911_31560 [Caldilineaceae bacterium]